MSFPEIATFPFALVSMLHQIIDQNQKLINCVGSASHSGARGDPIEMSDSVYEVTHTT